MATKRSKPQEMTTDQLVVRFAGIGIEQDEALLWNKIAKFNKLFEQMISIEDELKSRPGDQRRRLIDLFDHENAQVRLNAAKATLALAPAAARELIETLADSREHPQAMDAGMTIDALDDGTFKPT